MKGLLVCGLVLGVMVVWMSAVPSVTTGASSIGAWWLGCDGCDGVTGTLCTQGDEGHPPEEQCSGGAMTSCIWPGKGECVCEGSANPLAGCTGPEYCESVCNVECN